MEVSSQQGLLKLENRTFLAINQVERKSLISKSNKRSYTGTSIKRSPQYYERFVFFFLIDEVLNFIELLLIAVYRA